MSEAIKILNKAINENKASLKDKEAFLNKINTYEAVEILNVSDGNCILFYFWDKKLQREKYFLQSVVFSNLFLNSFFMNKQNCELPTININVDIFMVDNGKVTIKTLKD